jgi:hypothetical protein
MTPPALATRILNSLLPEFSREAILGDMQETFAQIGVEQGTAAARRWYWLETLAALPGFALHAMQPTQLRRQPVNGNIENENWFGRQNRLSAGLGFLLLLPGLIVVGFAVLVATFGEARMVTFPGARQLLAWLYSGTLQIGSVGLPIGLIILGGMFVALVMNFFAVVQIKVENLKEAYRATFTIRRKALNIILLVLGLLIGLGMDALIT